LSNLQIKQLENKAKELKIDFIKFKNFQKISLITELFDNFMQQDAHEFFNFLLNAISEVLAEEKRKEHTNGNISSRTANGLTKRSNLVTANVHDYSARFF